MFRSQQVVLVGFLLLVGNSFLSLMRSKSSINIQPKSGILYKTQIIPCPTKTKDELKPHSKSSSSEEDFQLLRWFNGLCHGTYIEMGALDGLSGSNSYLFNQQFNWKGLLIEPSSSRYELLIRNRPDELANVQAAVCESEQTVHYVDKGPVGAIWEFTTPLFRSKFWHNITLESPQVQKISCKPLRTIIQENIPETSYFDFFSLDVEGGEFTVLQSLDFEKVGFGIILTEANEFNNRKNLAVRSFLFSKGYYFLHHNGASDWFVNKDFGTIYKSVL